MINKKINVIILAVVVIICGAIIVFSRNDKKNNFEDIILPTSFSPFPTSTATLSPSISPKKQPVPSVKKTVTPTPGLSVKNIDDYESWVKVLDPLYRHLVLDQNCESIKPSQIAYPNGVQIMIDNGNSTLPRLLKIGPQEYFIGADEWLLITLKSQTLPAELKISCGAMELGSIELR
jgi:hypothetical protein